MLSKRVILANKFPIADDKNKNIVAVGSFAIIEQNTSEAISSIMAKLDMAKNIHLQMGEQMPFAKLRKKISLFLHVSKFQYFFPI